MHYDPAAMLLPGDTFKASIITLSCARKAV